ncbi:MAG: glucosaminidase domain-containing protein [Ignavibacteriaceae bacterium]
MIQAIYKTFYNKFFPLLAPVASDANVSPFFVLSVSALETGFGKYASHNNFFGIKAYPSHKSKFISRTKEYDTAKKKFVSVADSFRAYESFTESCLDFCRLIRHKYPQCIGVFDPKVCYLLQSNPNRRYATDPDYSKKLESLYFIFLSISLEGK